MFKINFENFIQKSPYFYGIYLIPSVKVSIGSFASVEKFDFDRYFRTEIFFFIWRIDMAYMWKRIINTK